MDSIAEKIVSTIKKNYSNVILKNFSDKRKKISFEDYTHYYSIDLWKHDKHSCEDCIFLYEFYDGKKCIRGLDVSDNHYCRYYETVKSCWICKNLNNYGYEDSWCNIDMSRKGESYHWCDNENNECPDWIWEGD